MTNLSEQNVIDLGKKIFCFAKVAWELLGIFAIIEIFFFIFFIFIVKNLETTVCNEDLQNKFATFVKCIYFYLKKNLCFFIYL